METQTRIAIVGYSGSGKSTLARKVAAYYQVPVLHLDTVQFTPGWKERDRGEGKAMVRQFMRREDWVIDGNYHCFYASKRLAAATGIVVLKFNRFASLWRAFKRLRKYRGRTRPDMAADCPEKIDAEFVRWILWEGRSRKQRQWYRDIARTYPEKTVVIKNQRGIDRYLRSLQKADAGRSGL